MTGNRWLAGGPAPFSALLEWEQKVQADVTLAPDRTWAWREKTMSADDMKNAAAKAAGSAKSTAQSSMHEASTTTGHAADQVMSSASHMADEVHGETQGIAASISQTASDLIGRAKEQASSLSDALPGSASDAYQAGQRAMAQGGDTVGRQVVKQPLEALLLAGAIGYLVGWATSRS